MEKTLKIRTRQRDHPTNPPVSETIRAVSISFNIASKTIRAVVKEELRKLFPKMPQPKVASLSEMTWKVQQAQGTSTMPRAPHAPQAMVYTAIHHSPPTALSRMEAVHCPPSPPAQPPNVQPPSQERPLSTVLPLLRKETSADTARTSDSNCEVSPWTHLVCCLGSTLMRSTIT